jgi:hypothetical protein
VFGAIFCFPSNACHGIYQKFTRLVPAIAILDHL